MNDPGHGALNRAVPPAKMPFGMASRWCLLSVFKEFCKKIGHPIKPLGKEGILELSIFLMSYFVLAEF
jgi:hypothetical protein